MPKLPDLPCSECGQPAGRGRHGERRKICTECAIYAAVKAAREMAQHAGPAYDKWLNTQGPTGRPRSTQSLE